MGSRRGASRLGVRDACAPRGALASGRASCAGSSWRERVTPCGVAMCWRGKRVLRLGKELRAPGMPSGEDIAFGRSRDALGTDCGASASDGAATQRVCPGRSGAHPCANLATAAHPCAAARTHPLHRVFGSFECVASFVAGFATSSGGLQKRLAHRDFVAGYGYAAPAGRRACAIAKSEPGTPKTLRLAGSTPQGWRMPLHRGNRWSVAADVCPRTSSPGSGTSLAVAAGAPDARARGELDTQLPAPVAKPARSPWRRLTLQLSSPAARTRLPVPQRRQRARSCRGCMPSSRCREAISRKRSRPPANAPSARR